MQHSKCIALIKHKPLLLLLTASVVFCSLSLSLRSHCVLHVEPGTGLDIARCISLPRYTCLSLSLSLFPLFCFFSLSESIHSLPLNLGHQSTFLLLVQHSSSSTALGLSTCLSSPSQGHQHDSSGKKLLSLSLPVFITLLLPQQLI